MRPRPFAQSLGIPLPKKTFERSYRLHAATMKVHRTPSDHRQRCTPFRSAIPMNDLLCLGGQAFLTLLREGAGHLFAAIRSLKVHGYDNGYMLQTTRKIR
jgi:hypothetical protein